MTHGEKYGLTALAIVLVVALAFIWLASRPSGDHAPASLPALPATETADTTTVQAPDSVAPKPRKRSVKRPRQPKPEVPDRPSPIDRSL